MSIAEQPIKTATAIPVKSVVAPAPEKSTAPSLSDFEEEDDEEEGNDDKVDAGEPVSASSTSANEFLTDDEDDDGEDDQATIEIFNTDCLNCKSLVPTAKKLYKKCHFSKGNEHCPAQSMQIVVRIPIEKIVRAFRTAERTNDTAELGRLYLKLATKESWYQDRVSKALEEARKKDAS